MRFAVLAVAIFGLNACASLSKSPGSTSNEGFPKCERVNCTEPVTELDPPEGAILSFETCNDGASRKYSYRRSGEVWVLTSYAMAATACPPSQP